MIKTTNRELFLLALLPYLSQNPICAELGVLEGNFSQMILDIINPEILYLVDPYETANLCHTLYGKELDYLPTVYSTQEDFDKLIERFKEEIKTGKVTIFREYSYDAVKSCPDNYLDLIYIDSDHRYEAVKRDLNDWLPKMKKGSIVSGHDYREFSNFGVIQAVDEFMIEHNFEMIVISNEGDFALKKING